MRDSEAAKALFEKFGLFKDPELLEKFVMASEVTVEVLDVFLSRVFGAERVSIVNDSGCLKALCESLCVSSLSSENEERHTRVDEANKEVEELRVKVQNMERQLCAMQRQLQMQVSQLAVSLEGRLDEISRECEGRISAVSDHVDHLEREVSDRARTGEVTVLSEEVSRLKDSERSLGDRIASVETKTTEVDRALRSEIQREIKRLDVVVNMIPCHGVIEKLTRGCGGNVHEKGVVEITASSCSIGSVKRVAKLETGDCFYSYGNPNQWICYDFKEWRVAPTGYSITSGSDWCPKSWVFQVSNDGKNWDVVDRRDNNEDFKAGKVTRNYELVPPPHGKFRFVRLLQTGPNHSGNDQLVIAALEVFGTLSSA